MVYYNVSNISSGNGVTDLFINLNSASNGFLASFLLLIIFAITYAALQSQDTDPTRALLGSLWLVFILSSFMLIIGSIPVLLWGMIMTGTAVLTIASFHR